MFSGADIYRSKDFIPPPSAVLNAINGCYRDHTKGKEGALIKSPVGNFNPGDCVFIGLRENL